MKSPGGDVMKTEWSKDKEFIIYSLGIVCMSVCSSLSPEEVEKRANQESPTGISSRWTITKDKFIGGEPNPCPCNISPYTHKHYLLTC